jgi:hypothetical protein
MPQVYLECSKTCIQTVHILPMTNERDYTELNT